MWCRVFVYLNFEAWPSFSIASLPSFNHWCPQILAVQRNTNPNNRQWIRKTLKCLCLRHNKIGHHVPFLPWNIPLFPLAPFRDLQTWRCGHTTHLPVGCCCWPLLSCPSQCVGWRRGMGLIGIIAILDQLISKAQDIIGYHSDFTSYPCNFWKINAQKLKN